MSMALRVAVLFAILLTQAPSTATRPAASQAAASSSTAASQPSSGDAVVDAILDRLELKGQAIRDLRADVLNEDMQTMPVTETNTKRGVILFRRAEPNPTFKVVFTERVDAGVVLKDREEFLFDGVWLIELHDKTHSVLRRQMAAEGQRVDLFKLGRGPFPLPFGQSRRDMLTNFTIAQVPSAAGDPPNTDHLVCTPRPASDLAQQFTVVHFMVDRKLDLPTRIMAERAKDATVVRVTFDRVQINTGLAMSEFHITVPAGYSESTEPLK